MTCPEMDPDLAPRCRILLYISSYGPKNSPCDLSLRVSGVSIVIDAKICRWLVVHYGRDHPNLNTVGGERHGVSSDTVIFSLEDFSEAS
jgi:hypothetical protein